MEHILDLAEQLGRAMAESPQAARMREAQKVLNEDKATSQLLADFQEQARKIAELEEQQKPVEVDDKHKLQDLHDRLVATGSFKKFTAAQVEYVDMMRRVSQAIHKPLGELEEA